jgi:hypothetical protein
MQMPYGVRTLDNREIAGPAKGAFCGFRLFFKSIRTATACLAGRLWKGLYGNVAEIATSSAGMRFLPRNLINFSTERESHARSC